MGSGGGLGFACDMCSITISVVVVNSDSDDESGLGSDVYADGSEVGSEIQIGEYIGSGVEDSIAGSGSLEGSGSLVGIGSGCGVVVS